MNKDLALKPVIRELVRTKVCFADIKLLVDKINIVQLAAARSADAYEAYRLFLTDRETTIQALVKRRLHKYLTRLDIQEGSYVVLKDYKLATAKRLNGKGEVRYLAISDLYSIGDDGRLEADKSGSANPSTLSHYNGKKRKKSAEPIADEARGDVRPNKVARTGAQATLNTALEPESSRSHEWYEAAAAEHHRLCHKIGDEIEHVECRSFTPYAQKAMKAGKPLQPIFRPLRLSTLASVTGTNASRNKTIDVLALIDSVDDHTNRRKDIPLYRDIHIADPSTERIVTLSVFIDPVDFLPNEGDIALFRSVTTHEYKGGKLNAYPQHCEGKDWFIPDPYCIKGCEKEFKAMEESRKRYMKGA